MGSEYRHLRLILKVALEQSLRLLLHAKPTLVELAEALILLAKATLETILSLLRILGCKAGCYLLNLLFGLSYLTLNL